MPDIIAGSPAPTNPAARNELLTALLEHDASGWIPEIHLDDCEDDACTGCEPDYVYEETAIQLDAERKMLALKREAADRLRVGLLAEQRHQFFDLDADSVPFPGAVYGSYLQLGGQS